MNSQNNSNNKTIPNDGILGLKENFLADAISGFTVFLLALPLSLGIAKASDFPPVMGLVTAIIGGIIVSFFAGSRLTIKGPAAGLIVIVAGAVADFGGGEAGWHIALGAVLVAAIIQIIFGLLKFGNLADFFPISAIHGMLSAIGIIIIAKQIPVLLNVLPSLTKGKSPFELIGSIPMFLKNMDIAATIIGLISLLIMLAWPSIKNAKIKSIPAPLVVLLIAIPAELILDFQHTEPVYSLVHIGDFLSNVHWNISFVDTINFVTFGKYVLMFALVGSLESLLTVKAIDNIDEFHRKSDPNKDLIAVGIGNTLAACLGGMPMISEVARSSANVNSGAKTRWANFFHGLFILIFVLFATPLIEMIPNTALAAMLISVGFKLAHPKEFIHAYHIGIEQLAIFLVTIFFTLYEDLLVGIFAGIALKIILHLIKGAPVKSLFKTQTNVTYGGDDDYLCDIENSAIFSNFIGIKNKLDLIPEGKNVTIDLSKTALVDHSAMGSLEAFKRDYEKNGGSVTIVGLDNHTPVSGHGLAARKNTAFVK